MPNYRDMRPHAAAGLVAAALIGSAVVCAASSAAAPQDPGGPGDPFFTCMTQNGVPAPPQGGPGEHPDGPPPQGAAGGPPSGQGGQPPAPPGVDQGVWNKALQACASLTPPPPQQR